MNLLTFTAKIITVPKLYKYNKKDLMYMQVSTVNNKKGLFSYIIYAKAKTKMAREIAGLYRKGDFIIIEGAVNIKFKSIKTNENKLKRMKFIIIRIKQVQPAYIIFK